MIYTSFISKEEQEDLIFWAMSCKSMLIPNAFGPHRFFNELKNLPKNKIIDNIKKRISLNRIWLGTYIECCFDWKAK